MYNAETLPFDFAQDDTEECRDTKDVLSILTKPVQSLDYPANDYLENTVLHLLAISFCIITAIPVCTLSSPLDNLSDHAKEILLIGKYPLDSFTVLWHDTSTRSMLVLSRPHDLAIEILRRQEVVAIGNPFPSSGDNARLLIQQQIEFLYGPWETNYSELHATATYVNDLGQSQALWSLTEEADEGSQMESFYVTTEYGCCDARPLHRAHRLTDGKLVMSYRSEFHCFDSSDADQASGVDRYIALHVPSGSEDGRDPQDSTFVAFLYYASRDSILHVAQINYIDTPITSYYWEPYYWHWRPQIRESNSVLQSLNQEYDAVYVSLTDPGRLPQVSTRCIVVVVDTDIPAFVIPIKDDDFLIEPQPGASYQIVRIR